MAPKTDKPNLSSVPPTNLAEARAITHRVVQFLSLAARANLQAQPDDSHSNLGWERETGRMSTHPIKAAAGSITITADFWPLSLGLSGNGASAALLLSGRTYAEASSWLDAQLERAGLKPMGSAEPPYELPTEVAAVDTFQPEGCAQSLQTLSSWYTLAERSLTTFAGTQSDVKPGPSPVRCWPHHFDIATYVSLEEGSAEAARGVGVGMSPGDESYAQPYFYVNPWPMPGPDGLPELSAPGQWHTQGFVGAIATAERALELADQDVGMTRFLDEAFATALGLLAPK